MKISYNWLKDYIKTDLSAAEISTILTSIGLEVEGLEEVGGIRGNLEGMIVAEVLTCEKHPDADKLHVTTVNTGSEVLQVVCGAPNVAAGKKVVLAQVGATLYPIGEEEGFKIKKSKIRGVESLGMLCAEDEIGVGKSHDGIILLSDNAKVGSPAINVFEIEKDTLLEIGLTPNRVDGASHYGVARDLAAYLQANGVNVKAELPAVSAPKGDNSKVIEVVVEDTENAPRYMGLTITGVKIKESPEWLKTKLRAIGINPKNNVVDITNFILHECGQPMHAFDGDKIKGNKIVVKSGFGGTKFVTLDGVERTLSDRNLMICNAVEPMCIAGVFGGLDAGVSDTTTTVFLESAYFNPVSVRKTAKEHGLSTDSSFRYERGADVNMTPYALYRCAQLICELAEGKVSSQVVDNYPVKIKPFEVDVNINRINTLIGKELERSKIISILKGLDIEIVSESGDDLKLLVPTYRVDVQREADVVEEVLRIYGFNNVENPVNIKTSITFGTPKTTEKLVNVISDMLSSVGCNEIMSNSLSKSSYYNELQTYKIDNCVKILNPLSSDLDVMRQTLLFSALEAVELNINRKRNDLKLYEIGKCYTFESGKGDGLKPYSEEQKISFTVTGNKSNASWNGKAVKSDFYTVKALVERVLERCGININEGTWSNLDSDLYNEGFCYNIRQNVLFEIGIVSKKIRSKFDIKQDVYYAEMSVEKLQKLVDTVKVQVCELSKFQPIKRDLALLVDKNITFGQLRDIACKAEKKLLKTVSIFDVYEGDKLPEGKKSYALSFVIEDSSKTLNDKEIEKIMSSITSALTHHAKAEVRGM